MLEKPYWGVKLDNSLREPVRRFAFDNNIKIGKFVSDAVRERLKKETKAGEQ